MKREYRQLALALKNVRPSQEDTLESAMWNEVLYRLSYGLLYNKSGFNPGEFSEIALEKQPKIEQ